MNSTPLTADQLAAIRQRAFSTKCAPNHPGALFTFMDGAKDAITLLAEFDRLSADRHTIRDAAIGHQAKAIKLVAAWRAEAADDEEDDDAFKRGVASGMAFCADSLTALLNGEVTS